MNAAHDWVGNGMARAVGVLGVTDRDDTREVVGDLDAVAAVVIAVAALAPT
ncbi:hypothetical protein SANTM175S_10447 [Streptomyces antimycoticus]